MKVRSGDGSDFQLTRGMINSNSLTHKEFIMWLRGFLDGVGDRQLSHKETDNIRDMMKRVVEKNEHTPSSEPIEPLSWPSYPFPVVPYYPCPIEPYYVGDPPPETDWFKITCDNTLGGTK